MDTEKSTVVEENKLSPKLENIPGVGLPTIKKKSLRPNKSIKRLSVLPKKFMGISRVRTLSNPQEKTPELG